MTHRRVVTREADADLAGIVILALAGNEVIVPQPGGRLEGGVMTQGGAHLTLSEESPCIGGQVADIVFGICRCTQDRSSQW